MSENNSPQAEPPAEPGSGEIDASPGTRPSDSARSSDDAPAAAGDTEADRRRAAQDEVLVELLAAGASYKVAAETIGITARTITRRMADGDFAARVSQRRGETVAEVTGQLTSMGNDALEVLRDCLAAEKPADRLRAAHLLLTLMARFRHETELEDRLATIERQLEAVDSQRQGAAR
jgi:hypothetical protein